MSAEMSKYFGLIGAKLEHSFSQKYFTEKFSKLGLKHYSYALFELSSIDLFPRFIAEFEGDLMGLNVTIPYKSSIIPFLDALSPAAEAIGAVNTIAFQDGEMIGLNSDVFGFESTLDKFMAGKKVESALILGTGGSSKAVAYILEKKGIGYLKVSRTEGKGDLTYDDLDRILISQTELIINTTPLGMHPDVNEMPMIPYIYLSPRHHLFDLIYNPQKTLFLRRGEEQNCHTMNGWQMLKAQAEKSWEFWQKYH